MSGPGPVNPPAGPANTNPSHSSSGPNPQPENGGQGIRRRVSGVTPTNHISRSQGSGREPAQPPIQDRNPSQVDAENPAGSSTPAAHASPAGAMGGSPAFQQAVEQLQGVVDEFWMRDQLELILKIMENPELADALHCKIKLKYPNTAKVVQLYPAIDNEIGPAHRGVYEKHLKQATEQALQNKQKSTPDHLLYSAYVAHRSKVCEIGEEEATAKGEFFEFMDVLRQMLVGRTQKQTMENGTTFNFTRLAPDQNINLDQLRTQQEYSGTLIPPSKKKTPQPDQNPPQPALQPAGIDLRLQASNEGIRQALDRPLRTDQAEGQA